MFCCVRKNCAASSMTKSVAMNEDMEQVPETNKLSNIAPSFKKSQKCTIMTSTTHLKSQSKGYCVKYKIVPNVPNNIPNVGTP